MGRMNRRASRLKEVTSDPPEAERVTGGVSHAAVTDAPATAGRSKADRGLFVSGYLLFGRDQL